MLHGKIATVLRDRFPETREAEPELLAYHFTESGAIPEAIPLWATAGQRAASRAAHVEAARHLQTALDLLRRQPADSARAAEELQLLIGLAVSLAASRGYSVPEVGKVLAEARAICDALGNVAGLFAVLRGICSFLIVRWRPGRRRGDGASLPGDRRADRPSRAPHRERLRSGIYPVRKGRFAVGARASRTRSGALREA